MGEFGPGLREREREALQKLNTKKERRGIVSLVWVGVIIGHEGELMHMATEN